MSVWSPTKKLYDKHHRDIRGTTDRHYPGRCWQSTVQKCLHKPYDTGSSGLLHSLVTLYSLKILLWLTINKTFSGKNQREKAVFMQHLYWREAVSIENCTYNGNTTVTDSIENSAYNGNMTVTEKFSAKTMLSLCVYRTSQESVQG